MMSIRGLATILLLVGGGAPVEEPIRFRWEKDDLLVYRLEADVREGKAKAHMEGAVRIRGLSPEVALLERVITSSVSEIPGEEPYRAAPDDLAALKIVASMDAAGSIPPEAAGDAEAREAAAGFVGSLFPIPPGRGPWDIRLRYSGDLLVGKGSLGGPVNVEGYPCAEITYRVSSAESGREMEGKAYFSEKLGAFVEVRREIRAPGPPERKETVRLRLRRHPTGPVLDGEYRKRLEISEEAIRRDPENPAAWARRAEVLRDGGSHRDALEAIRKARKIDPTVLGYLEEEGVLLGLLGQFDDAAGTLREVIEKRPDVLRPRLHLGRIEFQRGRMPEALKIAEGALLDAPRNPDALFLVGLIRAKMGDRAEARAMIQESYRVTGNTRPPRVTFDKEGNLRLILPRPPRESRDDPSLTEEERSVAREILQALVKDEAKRSEMGEEEVDRILEYYASLYGRDIHELIADLVEDREATWWRILRSVYLQAMVHPVKIAAAGASEDSQVRLGTAFFLTADEAVPMVQALIRESPLQADLRMHLVSILLRKGRSEAQGKMLVQAILSGRDVEPENGIYSYLQASILFEKGDSLAAAVEFAAAVQQPLIRTYRPEEARARRRFYVEVGYDPVFRAAAAWRVSRTLCAAPMRTAAEGVVALARKVEEDGDVKGARILLDMVLLAAAQVRGTAREVGLLREAHPMEVLALEARIALEKRQADDETTRRYEAMKEAALALGLREKKALEAFGAHVEDATKLWPITNAAEARDFMRGVLLNERAVFEPFLEAASRSDARRP